MAIDRFEFNGKKEDVIFVETTQVIDGVECDVYKFDGDNNKDLGIIRINAGCKTPLQKILNGDKTIEGYISGKGRLVITGMDGKQKIYNGEKGLVVEIRKDELMQWQADTNSALTAYEICFPPYQPGRFENI